MQAAPKNKILWILSPIIIVAIALSCYLLLWEQWKEPRNVEKLSSCDAKDVFVAGRYAYFTGYRMETLAGMDANAKSPNHTLFVLDVSEHENAKVVGSCDLRGYTYEVFVKGAYVYVGEHDGFFTIIDASNPENPVVVGSHPTGGATWGLYVEDDIAYVTYCKKTYAAGLVTFDVSSPGSPRLLGTLEFEGFGNGIDVKAPYAYIANGITNEGKAKLLVVDISDPTKPALVSECRTTWWAYAVKIRNGYAYVAANTSLDVIDVSNPKNPVLVGSCKTPGNAMDLFLSGSYAYVADSTKGVHIVDVSDPRCPRSAGSVPVGGWVGSVHIQEPYLYLCAEQSVSIMGISDARCGVWIINISNPPNPK